MSKASCRRCGHSVHPILRCDSCGTNGQKCIEAPSRGLRTPLGLVNEGLIMPAQDTRPADPPAPEGECLHEVTTVLKDAGGYGSEVQTDWEWCAGCGSVRRKPTRNWTRPANGTPNLPAALAARDAQIRELQAERDEAKRELAEVYEHANQGSLLYEVRRAEQAEARVAALEARIRDLESDGLIAGLEGSSCRVRREAKP